MQHPGFFERAGPFALAEVARTVGAELRGPGGDRLVSDVRPLASAGADDLAFLDNRKYVSQLATSTAAGIMLRPAMVERVPAGASVLVTPDPYRAFANALRMFYPTSLKPMIAPGQNTVAVHPTARIEAGAEVQFGAVIGAEAEIGAGTVIAAGAVVGYRCRIGRDGYVGPGASVSHALLGDRVSVHAGVRIGQDGFGYAMGRGGHYKVPQVGRVIIQDDVEIGANSTVDRGALSDTVIGEGTKIDNLVQIGHNVVIGRHCVIVGQVGLAGSCELGDFVVIGGQAGVVGHIKIGAGAMLAGGSHAKDDVPPGVRMGGTPARPIRQWVRQMMLLDKMSGGSERSDDGTET